MQLYDLVLINPPSPDLVNPHAQQPLGIMYLAAVAERDGFSVRLCNLAGAGMNPATWRIPLARVYGLTGTCLNIEAVNALAVELKRRNHLCRVLAGGPLTLSEDELDMDTIDTLVVGEGEGVISDLIRRAGPKHVAGVAADMRTLPMPARHLWPGPFGGNVFIGGYNYFGGGSATLLTSRGCPHKCAFCAGPAINMPPLRFRPPESVVAEMELLVTDFGVHQFRLSDEFFTAKREHMRGVCDGIVKSKLLGHGKGIAWRASIAVRPNDSEMFAILASAGCKECSFGVESADPDVLALLCRKGGPDDACMALANARAAGIKTRALMMVGLPGETVKTPKLNIAFIESGVFDAVAVTVFTPLPGCDIAANPGRYRCELIPERGHRSLCLYGPDGKNAILPTVRLFDYPERSHAADMAATVAAAERAGKLGRGAA